MATTAKQITVYMHPPLHQTLRVLAAEAGVSMSEYLKLLVVQKAEEAGKVIPPASE